MNRLFTQMLDDNVPRFNKYVVDGIVKHELKKMPEFVDTIFRSSTKSFSEGVDIVYEGYRMVSPEEEFTRQFTKSASKKAYDIAQSDVYPLCFIFRHKHDIIEKVLLMPYARKGNLMSISGSEKVIIPVLSDSIISPSEQQAFVRLYKDKITFKSEPHNFIYNGDTRTSNNIWVVILKDEVKGMGLGDASIPPAALYLLGKYGFKETVLKYFNREMAYIDGPEVREDDVLLVYGDTTPYKDEYNIYSSRGVKPPKLAIVENYIPHDVSICVRKNIKETAFIKNFIFGLLYSLDILPGYGKEIAEAVSDNDLDIELSRWRIVLGTITYKKTKTLVKVMDDTRELFIALDNYIDGTIIRRLSTVGIIVKDFYDLVYEILRRYDDWSLKAKEYNMDVNNRHIDVLYYMGYPYIEKINRAIYSVNKRNKKARQQNKNITLKEIMSLIGKELKQPLIYSVVKSAEPHFNVKTADAYNSSVYLSTTSLLEDQGCAKGVLIARDNRMPTHCKFLNAHAMFFGSVLYLSKSKPSINFRINPFVVLDKDTGKIIFNDKQQKDIEHINSLIVNVRDEEDNEEYADIMTDRDSESVSD